MALYIAYAWVQGSEVGGDTPTYDIYDSDNYPMVSLKPQATIAHTHKSPIPPPLPPPHTSQWGLGQAEFGPKPPERPPHPTSTTL